MEFVDKNETLARFITSKRHYSTLRNEVKYNLFMPPQDLKLSVYRTDTLTEQEKWV